MIDPLEDSSSVTVALSGTADFLDEAPASLQLLVLLRGHVVSHGLPTSGTLVIGRSRGSDIRIDDESISRQHVLLHIAAGAVAVEDCGSVNGTVVSGKRLVPNKRTALAVGDLIQVGAASLLIQEVGPVAEHADARIVVEPEMRSLTAMTERIAGSDLSVLLLGETGVGKDVFARTIHAASRRSGRFVPINCAALSDSLVESELFGHEKGAFTNAGTAKTGLLEAADDGTVLLDEVGEMPLPTQAKLLRVLEDREIRRVGAVHARRINVRFVAATNRDLEQDVERGTFRRDLFFRLNGVTLNIPPLRARRSEIEPLARSFAARASAGAGRPAPELDIAAVRTLHAYSWPGNIRELRHVIERAVVLCGTGPILPEHLQLADESRNRRGSSPPPATSPRRGEAPDERERVLAALDKAQGNQTLAAKLLNISRRTLINRLDEFGLPRPRKDR